MPSTPSETEDTAGHTLQPSRSATRVGTLSEGSTHENRSPSRIRKITGVLVTFTWQPQGQLFEIYEGKNFIGRGTVGTEDERPCDVLITTDDMLSSEHALILCRAGRHELFDQKSANGTFMDDKFVGNQGIALHDRAQIKTGATLWTFIMIREESTPIPVPPPR